MPVDAVRGRKLFPLRLLTNALKPRCEIMSSVRDRVMDDQR